MLYGHRDNVEAKKSISRILDHLGPPSGCRVLDLACGRGRHAVHLQQSGVDVVGVDLSPENIAYAQRFATTGLEFHVHDMRAIFEKEGFDLVFNLFTSFGYFESYIENFQVIEAVHSSLRSGGLFVLDFLNPLRANLEKEVTEELILEKCTFRISKRIEEGTFVKHINVIDENETFDFEERVKAFDVWHLSTMLENAGFVVQNVFGNYALEPFVGPVSERTILIGKK